MSQLKVLDTNILLLDAQNLIKLGIDGSTIVLPETTLDELDAKKEGFGELAYQSRSLARMLAGAKDIGKTKVESLFINHKRIDKTEVWIVSSTNYPDFSGSDPKIVNDRMIIDIASQLKEALPKDDVTFISNDVMCRLRADAVGLNVDDVKDVERVSFEFTRTLEVPDDVFRSLHGKMIKDVDPNATMEQFNYKFTSPDTKQMKLASIFNGVISVIGKESESELRKQDINPANAEQLFLSRAIQDTNIDIVICDAKAGSGKTLVSVSNALRLLGIKSPYGSLTYIRASVNDVEDVEEVGFLPGDEAAKNLQYLHPLFDSLDFIVRAKYGNGKLKGKELEEKVTEEVEKMMEKYHIEAMTGLGLRGRTFHNTIAIIDEVQNMTRASLHKTMTRFGKDCKVILIGSNNQIDHPHLNKYTNGLSAFLGACVDEDEHDLLNLYAVSLRRVVRGKIAEFSERLFTKDAHDA